MPINHFSCAFENAELFEQEQTFSRCEHLYEWKHEFQVNELAPYILLLEL
jgi:hypothetical protein